MESTKKPSEKGFLFEDTEYLTKTLDSLNKLRRNRQFCDVVLLVGSEPEVHAVHAHRAVLASASPFLLELFSGEPQGGLTHKYKVTGDFDLEAFERLIDYAYTSRLEAPRDKVRDLYKTAKKLRMISAAQHCGRFLADNLTPENCISVRCIPGITSDIDLVKKVDAYIKQNMEKIVKGKSLASLPLVQVELLQNTSEEMQATNTRHLCNMILDWIKQIFDDVEVNFSISRLTEKVHMLYLNLDHTLHDCDDIENGDVKDSELIQDYKKLSRKITPTVHRSTSKKAIPIPAKPAEFLYTKDESYGSPDVETREEEKDWRVIATVLSGEHIITGLAVVAGKLIVLSAAQRLNALNATTPPTSRSTSVEKPDMYTLIPPMASARCGGGTADLQGKLLVCGGYNRVECLKTVEVYDLSTNKWSLLKSMNIPRGRFNVAVVGEKVYAIGGCDGTKDLNSVEVYDPISMKWKLIPHLPMARSNAGVCHLDGKIYLIGGINGQKGVTECNAFDSATETWTTIAPLVVGRYQPGVTALNEHVYAVGGCESWSCLNSVEKYNPNTNTWVLVSSMHTARRGCGVAVFNGKLYAVGGHDGVHSLCSVEIYDPETNTWSPGPSLTSCRGNVGVCVVENRLFAVGGFNGRAFVNTVEFLDIRTNEWTTFVAKELTNKLSNKKIKEYNQNGLLENGLLENNQVENDIRQTNGFLSPLSQNLI